MLCNLWLCYTYNKYYSSVDCTMWDSPLDTVFYSGHWLLHWHSWSAERERRRERGQEIGRERGRKKRGRKMEREEDREGQTEGEKEREG